MAKKIFNNDIARSMALAADVKEEEAELFIQHTSELIEEILQAEGVVEINDFGVFKTVDMGERESVSVSNGERIVIPGYKKITFTEKNVKSQNVEAKSSAKTSTGKQIVVESQKLESTPVVEPISAKIKDSDKVAPAAEPEQSQPVREKPVDEFSGIDVLIATPEAMDDMTDRIEQAESEKNEAEDRLCAALNQLQAAQSEVEAAKTEAEKVLEKLSRLNASAENMRSYRPAVIDRGEDENQRLQASAKSNVLNLDRNIEQEHGDNPKTPFLKNKKWMYALAAFPLIALITLFLLLTCKDDNPKPQNGEMEEVKKEVNDANNNSGNLQQNTQKDNNADTDVKSNTSEPQNVKQEEQVDKVVFDGVKPLEIIVTEHYGDHDKVFQVIDYNKKHGVFSDWTKISVGTEILLPKL